MSHLTLYRKHRPGEFDAVVGQSHITEVLKRAVEEGSFSHAYLFAGRRGTGKTSTARILARSIGAGENDIYEIDAASNRGINDIRELKEAVETLPFDSPYKVYIIDEVHMLTKEAFNALLKTLEEPPSHVVFMLATTEMHKLPETIISRCEVHTFNEPDTSTLVSFVKEIAEREGYTLENEAANRIALLAEGGFRDALSLLQKTLSGVGGKKVTLADVESLTGSSGEHFVMEYIRALSEKSLSDGLTALNAAEERGVEQAQFTSLLLRYIRFIILVRAAPSLGEERMKNIREDIRTALKEYGESGVINSGTLLVLLEKTSLPPHPALPYLSLELALMELLGHDTTDKK